MSLLRLNPKHDFMITTKKKKKQKWKICTYPVSFWEKWQLMKASQHTTQLYMSWRPDYKNKTSSLRDNSNTISWWLRTTRDFWAHTRTEQDGFDDMGWVFIPACSRPKTRWLLIRAKLDRRFGWWLTVSRWLVLFISGDVLGLNYQGASGLQCHCWTRVPEVQAAQSRAM